MSVKKKQQTSNDTVMAMTQFAIRNCEALNGKTLSEIRAAFRKGTESDAYFSAEALEKVLKGNGIAWRVPVKARKSKPEGVRILATLVAQILTRIADSRGEALLPEEIEVFRSLGVVFAQPAPESEAGPTLFDETAQHAAAS